MPTGTEPGDSTGVAAAIAARSAGVPSRGRGRRARRFSTRLAGWLRWLHIYASMLGLATVLFFGATGLTLNHPAWFFGNLERQERAEGSLPSDWLAATSTDPDRGEPAVRKLEIVERLRAEHHLRGAVSEFRVDETECLVLLKGPGYSADAFIDRATGEYEVTQTFHGAVAILNDLHKGRDTGPVWSVVIDVSAVLLVFIALTGLTLLFYLKLRRWNGLWVGLAGLALVAALGYWLVP